MAKKNFQITKKKKMTNYKNAFNAVWEIFRNSAFILYDEETLPSIVIKANFCTSENVHNVHNCPLWAERFQGSDVNRLEKQGITREKNFSLCFETS